MGSTKAAWARAEPWLFRLLALLHLLPVWSSRWFVTLDGPAHLYSARLVLALVQGDAFIGRFFHLSTYPEPYWTGHAVMAALLAVLPAWLVEKITWSLAVLGLAWAFRHLILLLAPKRPWASWLAFPFLLHYAAGMGFLNFSLSLPLMLATLAAAWQGILAGRMRTALLAVLFLLLYFTHLFTFLATAGMVLAMACWCAFTTTWHKAGKLLLQLFAALALPLLLTLGYGLAHARQGPPTAQAGQPQLWHWLLTGRAWNALGLKGEERTCTVLALVLLLAGAAALVSGLRSTARRPGMPDFWPLLSLACFAAYFMLPDTVAGGSNVSPRFLLFAMLFLACSVSISKLPDPALAATLALLLPFGLYHTCLQVEAARGLGRECDELLEVRAAIPDQTVLLPLNYSGNWMHSNLSNYLGTANERVIVLDHFTALAPFNPVQWNSGMLPYGPVGNFATSNSPCVRIAAYRAATGTAINAALTWKMQAAPTDSCLADTKRQLREGFLPRASSQGADALLYTSRPGGAD